MVDVLNSQVSAVCTTLPKYDEEVASISQQGEVWSDIPVPRPLDNSLPARIKQTETSLSAFFHSVLGRTGWGGTELGFQSRIQIQSHGSQHDVPQAIASWFLLSAFSWIDLLLSWDFSSLAFKFNRPL